MSGNYNVRNTDIQYSLQSSESVWEAVECVAKQVNHITVFYRAVGLCTRGQHCDSTAHQLIVQWQPNARLFLPTINSINKWNDFCSWIEFCKWMDETDGTYKGRAIGYCIPIIDDYDQAIISANANSSSKSGKIYLFMKNRHFPKWIIWLI